MGWRRGEIADLVRETFLNCLRMSERRLTVDCRHTTFCINSLAHWTGLQPYTEEVTAKGNYVGDKTLTGIQSLLIAWHDSAARIADLWRGESQVGSVLSPSRIALITASLSFHHAFPCVSKSMIFT